MQNIDPKNSEGKSIWPEQKLYNFDDLSGKFVGLETKEKTADNYQIIVNTNNEVLNIIQSQPEVAVDVTKDPAEQVENQFFAYQKID